jgi:hypothetical protein
MVYAVPLSEYMPVIPLPGVTYLNGRFGPCMSLMPKGVATNVDRHPEVFMIYSVIAFAK